MKNRKFAASFILLIFILTTILSGCTVKVNEVTIETVPTLNVGENYQLVYTVKPDNATDKTVYFKSSDDNIASIDSNGLIKALGPGSVDITIYANKENSTDFNDADIKSTTTITVVQPVTSVSFNSDLIVLLGRTNNADAIILPENASDKTLVYTSSDESIASIDSNGTITGIKKGNAVINCISANGLKAECSVNVKQPVTAIELNNKNLTLAAKSTATIKATLSPADADFNTDITFSSSDKSVATVNAHGKITAIKQGKAVITASVTDADGNLITAACEVQVTQKKSATSNSSSNSNSNSNSSSSSSSNSQSTNAPKIFLPEFDQSIPCGGCCGSGYMISGEPCYLCDYWK